MPRTSNMKQCEHCGQEKRVDKLKAHIEACAKTKKQKRGTCHYCMKHFNLGYLPTHVRNTHKDRLVDRTAHEKYQELMKGATEQERSSRTFDCRYCQSLVLFDDYIDHITENHREELEKDTEAMMYSIRRRKSSDELIEEIESIEVDRFRLADRIEERKQQLVVISKERDLTTSQKAQVATELHMIQQEEMQCGKLLEMMLKDIAELSNQSDWREVKQRAVGGKGVPKQRQSIISWRPIHK